MQADRALSAAGRQKRKPCIESFGGDTRIQQNLAGGLATVSPGTGAHRHHVRQPGGRDIEMIQGFNFQDNLVRHIAPTQRQLVDHIAGDVLDLVVGAQSIGSADMMTLIA